MREILVRPMIAHLELERHQGTWSKRYDAELRPMGRLVRNYKTSGQDMHRHITRRTKGMGTVEVTYLPSKGTLIVLVHDNRQGFWAGKAYENLAGEMKSVQ